MFTSYSINRYMAFLFRQLESLLHDEVEIDFGEQLVVLARVAYVGKYLCQGLLVVLGNELMVLGQALLVGIEALDILGRVVVITLVVDDSLDG